MSSRRIWIVDGHNMIFAIPRLERLQVTGHRNQARADLVGTLRRFAETRRQNVLVVFDGNDLQRNPDVVRESFIDVTYTRRSDGEADDRIIHEARLLSERGHHVTVVTNDINTLARMLPGGVEHLPVRAFWQKCITIAQPGKLVEGDFSDVESEMQALAAVAEPAAHSGAPLSFGAPASAGKPAKSASSESDAQRERILRKKARGRARQERRLKRRLKSGRG